MEARCEELNKQLEECRQSLTAERRKNERLTAESNSFKLKATQSSKDNNDSAATASDTTTQSDNEANTTAPENCSFAFASPGSRHNANSTGISCGGVESENTFDLSMICDQESNNEIIKLVNDLETMKRAFMAEQQRCSELEEQLVAYILIELAQKKPN